MALEKPSGFPDESWPSVVASEAAARSRLLTDLDAIGWQSSGSGRYLSRDHVKDACQKYAVAVADAFAQQACEAAKNGALPIARLDNQIEKFVDAVLHHIEFGIEDSKLHFVWRRERHTSIREELRPRIMGKPWHRQYLERVPTIVSSLSKPAFALSPLAEQRRSVVQPILDRLGLTPSSWATRAGFDPSVAYDYLHGKSNPRPDSRLALAEVLGLKPEGLP